MDLHYLILREIRQEIEKKHPKANINAKVYGHDGQYQLFITKVWGSNIVVNLLPAGIHIYLTGKADETDRFYPYEDYHSIEDAIAHIETLLEVKPYKWQTNPKLLCPTTTEVEPST